MFNRRHFLILTAALASCAAGGVPSLSHAVQASWSVKANGQELLERFLSEIQAAAGRFKQTAFDREGRRSSVSSGRFKFLRPGCFEWVYEDPYRQEIVSDGKTLWLYDEDLMQVTEKTLSAAIPSTPAAFLFGEGKIPDVWEISVLEDEGNEAVLVIPPEGESFTMLEFIFKDGVFPSVVQFRDSFGQVTRLEFSNVGPTDAKPADFKFKAPEGVDMLKDG